MGGRSYQREDPPVTGGAWVTTSCSIMQGEILNVRARYLVIGIGEDCTAEFSYQQSLNGTGPWQEFWNVKFAQGGFTKWYVGDFVGTWLGHWHTRVQMDYDGSLWYTNIIEIDVLHWEFPKPHVLTLRPGGFRP